MSVTVTKDTGQSRISAEIVDISRTGRGTTRGATSPDPLSWDKGQAPVTAFDHDSFGAPSEFSTSTESVILQPEEDAPLFDGMLERARVAPAKALKWVAESWFGDQIRGGDILNGPLAPEAAEVAAAALGIDLTIGLRRLSRLHESEFPCLLLDREGYAYLILGRADAGRFYCRTEEGDLILERSRLQTVYSGSVFLLRPHAKKITGADDGHGDATPVSSIMRYLFSTMLNAHPWAVTQIALAALVSNILLIILPIFTMAVYDRVIPHLAFDTLWALSIGMIIVLSADLAIRHVKLRLIDFLAAEVSHAVQVRFYRTLIFAKLIDVPGKSSSFTNALRDLESYCQLLPLVLVSALIDMPFVIATTIILAMIAGSVALVPIAGALLIGAVFAIAHLRGHRHLQPHLTQIRAQTNMVAETIDGLETVKTSAAETMMLNRWARLVDSSAYASHASRLDYGMAQHWANTISQLMTIGALVLGVYEISINTMTVGALSASTMLISRLIGPIVQMVTQTQRLLQAPKTLEPIRVLLNLRVEAAGSEDQTIPATLEGQFDFVKVGFTYPQSPLPSLTDITISVQPGERIGIIGRVGCGKSTLLRLMVRLLDPTEGTIRLDGRDVRQADPRALRRQIIYVSQDSFLFDDTLSANLLYGHESATKQKINEAVSISTVASFAGRSPAGYGMRVGPRGDYLSGGERQAVRLARALIADPQMLILDEPTAAMDNSSERHVIDGLSKWLGKKTLIVATHRAAILDLVDRLILMHEGRIVADGPKHEVLKKLQAT